MIRALKVLILGVVIASAVLATAVVAAVGIMGMAAQSALFGDAREPFAVKTLKQIIQRGSEN